MCLFHSKKRKMWLTMYNIRERERERVPPEIISLLLSFGCTRNHWIEIFEKSMVVLLWETMRSIEPKHWRPSKSNKGISFPSGLLCSSNWKKKQLQLVLYMHILFYCTERSLPSGKKYLEKKRRHTQPHVNQLSTWPLSRLIICFIIYVLIVEVHNRLYLQVILCSF